MGYPMQISSTDELGISNEKLRVSNEILRVSDEKLLWSAMKIWGSLIINLWSPLKIQELMNSLESLMKSLGFLMISFGSNENLGSPMKSLESPMKIWGTSIKEGPQWYSNDDDFFPGLVKSSNKPRVR